MLGCVDTDRCYRQLVARTGKTYLTGGSGWLFDPHIVEIFLNMLKENNVVSSAHLDSRVFRFVKIPFSLTFLVL
jgi:response regulator RpfG family c-di-GMP phosphodiesterase